MGPNTFDGWYSFISVVPLIIYLGVIILAIYFVIKVIRFMNEKTKLDKEKNEKLTEIIKSLKDKTNKEI